MKVLCRSFAAVLAAFLVINSPSQSQDEGASMTDVQSYMGQVISGTSGAGNAQLWNPFGSGKILVVDKVIVAGSRFSGNDPLGADIRRTRAPLASLFADHSSNKVFGGPDAKAEIRFNEGASPNNYPLNRPIQEIWLGTEWQDRPYTFDPPIKVPQGWGVVVSMTGGARVIASWQWSEEEDPQGPIAADPYVPVEAIATDLTNGPNVFDATDVTFASSESNSFYIGKTWAEEKTISSITIKSPAGRSFAGAAPPRVLNYFVDVFDGVSWVQAATGSFTDAAYNAQSTLNASGSWKGFGHRVRVTDPSVAAHRVAVMGFAAP